MTKPIQRRFARTNEAAAATPTRRYDETFKRQAVEYWLESDKPGPSVASDLGVSYPSLKKWKRRSGANAMPARADLAAENRALKAELARVREQRDTLKKTLSILTEPSRFALIACRSQGLNA